MLLVLKRLWKRLLKKCFCHFPELSNRFFNHPLRGICMPYKKMIGMKTLDHVIVNLLIWERLLSKELSLQVISPKITKTSNFLMFFGNFLYFWWKTSDSCLASQKNIKYATKIIYSKTFHYKPFLNIILLLFFKRLVKYWFTESRYLSNTVLSRNNNNRIIIMKRIFSKNEKLQFGNRIIL